MVLPTVGNDTIPSQRALSRKFGDDVYRDIGCQSGMFMSLKLYLTTLGMDTTADFLGEMKTFKTDEGRTEVTYFDFGPFQQQSDTEEQKAVLFLAGLGSLMRSWSPVCIELSEPHAARLNDALSLARRASPSPARPPEPPPRPGRKPTRRHARPSRPGNIQSDEPHRQSPPTIHD